MTLLLGNNLELLRTLPDNSVDAVATDPPYGLGKEPDALAMLRDWMETGHHDVKGKGFMGKAWDAFVPQPVQWREVFRVLKPGGHVLAFAGTRTQDLMALGLRLAGFEIRDLVAWVYGSGFPKSLDVSKAIDKMAGAEREVVGEKTTPDGKPYSARTPNSSGEYNSDCSHNSMSGKTRHNNYMTAPATEAAKQWDGWGTALKPALEPITLARKPLEGTVAQNVLKWHTGALNVDGCRADTQPRKTGTKSKGDEPTGTGNSVGTSRSKQAEYDLKNLGRWPANLIHDGSEEVVGLFPHTSSGAPGIKRGGNEGAAYGSESRPPGTQMGGFGDSGSAARFFYCAKTSKADRNDGCEALPDKEWVADGACIPERENRPFDPSKNNHPTVKPTALMRYLCRLITPPGGTILDPWMGSGSTGKAANLEGFEFIGMEQDAGYFEIAKARCGVATEEDWLPGPVEEEPDFL